MATLIMPVWDTDENQRTACTEKTLNSLLRTVDWSHHRLIISDNNSCQATRELYTRMASRLPFELQLNGDNLGCAGAVNKAWSTLDSDEIVVKLDNDIEFVSDGWLDVMVSAMDRAPRLGILGLKRDDIQRRPTHPVHPTILQAIPQNDSLERQIVLEFADEICGSCTMFRPQMVREIGRYETLEGLYGFEDLLYCHVARAAKWSCAYLPNVYINHLGVQDSTEYFVLKNEETKRRWGIFCQRRDELNAQNVV